MQITLPRTHVGRRKVDKLGRTQKTPTDKSAMAKLPRKKFVIDRRRGLRQIANSTIRFPETGHTYIYIHVDVSVSHLTFVTHIHVNVPVSHLTFLTTIFVLIYNEFTV